tara:strand:- start:1230 stop:2006 length:777 start_codon:yes stop_codon:yes gene_type:complete
MKNDKGVLKRYIVTPDKHAPLHDKKAISVLKQAIEIIKPTGYIDLGDLGEWGSVSHWQWKRKKKPPLEYIIPRVDDDVDSVNMLLDTIDESLDKANVKIKHMIQGNHDVWLDMFVDQHPYLPQYKFDKACMLKERGYKYHKEGEYLSIGDLNYYHGHHFGGQYHTANHLRKLRASVMYGHWHGIQMMSSTGLKGATEAWCIGCMKDMSKEKNKWLKGRPIDWVHSFAIVDYFKGGKFAVTLIRIIDGKASIWGKEIKG